MPKHKFSLKSGKTLEYKNGKWYYDGKLRSTKNFTLVDVDGYHKSLMPDGSLAVQDVDENGKPIKHSYIGSYTRIPKKGTKDRQKIIDKVNKETAKKYWDSNPIIRHATDSIANAYKISPELLRNRLDAEGFTQSSITLNNRGDDSNSYNALNTNYNWKTTDKNGNYIPGSPGFIGFGLDDVATMINNGDVKLINEKWSDSYNTNEHKRIVHTADGFSNKDNIGIVAATLKYFRDKAAQDFPNSNRIFLDEAAGVYYNRGTTGGKKYMKSKKK